MSKRVLWYALLVLLCCSLSVILVHAAKTTGANGSTKPGSAQSVKPNNYNGTKDDAAVAKVKRTEERQQKAAPAEIPVVVKPVEPAPTAADIAGWKQKALDAQADAEKLAAMEAAARASGVQLGQRPAAEQSQTSADAEAQAKAEMIARDEAAARAKANDAQMHAAKAAEEASSLQNQQQAPVSSPGNVLPPDELSTKSASVGNPEVGNRGESPLDASNGGDAYGYVWEDNQAPDTIVYDYINLWPVGSGATRITAFSSDDQVISGIPLGFSYTFYGTAYTTVNVSTNGNLQFGGTQTAYSNLCNPTSTSGFTSPEISVFWDDLYPVASAGTPRGGIWYETFGSAPNRYFVIEWDSCGNSTYPNAECILYENAQAAKVQVRRATVLTSSTTGIQQSGTVGVSYNCNSSGVNPPAPNRAVKFFYKACPAPVYCDATNPEVEGTTPAGNNLCANTNVLALDCNTTLSNAVHCTAGDSDYYKITVPSNQMLTVTLKDGAGCTRTPAQDVQFKYRASLCTNALSTSAFATFAFGNCSGASVDYFVVVYGTSTNVRGAYQIVTSCAPLAACGSPAEDETTNNTCAGSNWALNYLNCATQPTIYGVECPTTDSDFVKITVAAGTMDTIRLYDGAGCTRFPPVDVNFRYRAGACTGVAITSVTTGQAVLVNCTASPVDYYVAVYKSSTSVPATWKMTASCANFVACGTPTEDETTNSTCAGSNWALNYLDCSTQPILYGLECPTTDSDFVKITVAAGTFDTVRLYDGAGCTRFPATDVYFRYRAGACTGVAITAVTTGQVVLTNCTGAAVDYYLVVYKSGTSVPATWKMTVTCGNILLCGTPTETENNGANNHCTTPDPFVINPANPIVYGYHCLTDSDFYQVTIPAGQAISLQVYDGGPNCTTVASLTYHLERPSNCVGITYSYTSPFVLSNCGITDTTIFLGVYDYSTGIYAAPYKVQATYYTRPTTDVCATAQQVSITPGGMTSVFGTTNGACPNNATDDPIGTCYTATIYYAQWYKVQGNGDIMRFSTCNTYTATSNAGGVYDTQMDVYRGNDCTQLVCLGGSADGPCTVHSYLNNFVYCTKPESTYWVAIGCYSASFGNFQFDVLDSAYCLTGSCCYDYVNNPLNPQCQSPTTPAQCTALGGFWTQYGTCQPPVPPNNNNSCRLMPEGSTCTNPYVISTMPYSHPTDSTCGMGADYSNTCLTTTYDSYNDVVYKWVADADTCIQITLTVLDASLYNYWGLAVFDNACPPTGCVGHNGVYGTSPTTVVVNVGVTTGHTYYILVDNGQAVCGHYSLAVNKHTCFYGDNCAKPITISSLPYTHGPDSTALYANDYNWGSGTTFCGNITYYYWNNRDQVFAYTAASDMSLDVILNATSTYPCLSMWDGCPNTAGTNCVAGMAQSGAGTLSLSCISLMAGHTYYILIDDWPSPQPYTVYSLLSVSQCFPCPTVSCPGSTNEAEYNGGCLAATYEAFNTVTNGSIKYGNVTTDGTTRDFDGYELVVNNAPVSLTVAVNPEFDAIIQLNRAKISDVCPDSLTLLTTNAAPRCNTETLTYDITVNGIYHIYVYPPLTPPIASPKNYCMTVATVTGSVPGNDLCANAYGVSVPSTNAGTTHFATADYPGNAVYCGSYAYGPGVWYTVEGTGDSIYASLCASATSWNSAISVYTGSCGSFTCYASNDDACSVGGHARIGFCTTLGTTYYILVYSGTAGLAGDFTLTMSAGGVCRACPSCTPENVDLGVITTTPWGGTVSSDCSFGGKWVGKFTAQVGDAFHFDLCPDAPGNGSAVYDEDIKVCDASCAILAGVDYTTGCSVNDFYDPNDFQWSASASGTYYVIIAPYSSYASHNCLGDATDVFTLNYYREQCLPLPPNDECTAAVPVVLPLNGSAITFTGNNTCATPDCPSFPGEGNVWHAFTLSTAASVVLDYCTTAGPFGNSWLNLAYGCPCTGFTAAATYETTTCSDANVTMTWLNLAAGTYYYPVMRDGTHSARGPYTIHVHVIPCDSVQDLTVYQAPAPDTTTVWLRWTANTTGAYKIYKTFSWPPFVDPSNLVGITSTGTAGPLTWMDPDGSAYLAYYLVVHDCAPYGSCCYGTNGCAVNTQAECVTLGGVWTAGGTCPCPTGRCCYGNPSSPTCEVDQQSACTLNGGTWTVGLTCATACPILPPNDECANAIEVFNVALFPNDTISGNNALATTSATPPAPTCQTTYGHDLFYKYVSTADNTTITMSTCFDSPNTTFDTIIAVYQGSCSGTQVGCNDDSCGDTGFPPGFGTASYATFTSGLTGTVYYIRVAGWSTYSGDFKFFVSQ